MLIYSLVRITGECQQTNDWNLAFLVEKKFVPSWTTVGVGKDIQSNEGGIYKFPQVYRLTPERGSPRHKTKSSPPPEGRVVAVVIKTLLHTSLCTRKLDCIAIAQNARITLPMDYCSGKREISLPCCCWNYIPENVNLHNDLQHANIPPSHLIGRESTALASASQTDQICECFKKDKLLCLFVFIPDFPVRLPSVWILPIKANLNASLLASLSLSHCNIACNCCVRICLCVKYCCARIPQSGKHSFLGEINMQSKAAE